MANLPISTVIPQDTDTERLLLARLLFAASPLELSTGADGSLASAARTVSTTGADIVTNGRQAAIAVLNVTVASGTGGLSVRWQMKDPISGNYVNIGTGGNRTTTGTQVTGYGIGTTRVVGGATVGSLDGIEFPLGSKIRVQVVHGDGSSYTYSVAIVLR